MRCLRNAERECARASASTKMRLLSFRSISVPLGARPVEKPCLTKSRLARSVAVFARFGCSGRYRTLPGAAPFLPGPDRRYFVQIGLRRLAAGLTLLAVFCIAALAEKTGWIDVPFVRQVRAGCGPAAIAMVMQYWVKQIPALDAAAAGAEHIDKALPAGSNGTFGKDLKEYLEAHGFSAYVFDGEMADLRNHLAKGRPVVVCLGLKGPDAPLHYVVVVGIANGEVLLNDPARGKLFREKTPDFLRAWKATGNWALLAVPRQTR